MFLALLKILAIEAVFFQGILNVESSFQSLEFSRDYAINHVIQGPLGFLFRLLATAREFFIKELEKVSIEHTGATKSP